MVEASNDESSGENALDLETTNLELLVHSKAFQCGLLHCDKRFVSVPGYVYGTKRILTMYDETSSFLPFSMDKTRYEQEHPFTDILRPYQEGY